MMDRMNAGVVALLHTPGLHWLASPGLMTVTLSGRRSGRRICFPVGYRGQRDALLVLVSNARSRNWWRNFREPWPAEIRLRGRKRAVIGELLTPGSDEYRDRVGAAFRRAAFIPRMFEIDFDRARGLSDEQRRRLGDYAAVVCFRDA
jgi:hypothetical protein